MQSDVTLKRSLYLLSSSWGILLVKVHTRISAAIRRHFEKITLPFKFFLETFAGQGVHQHLSSYITISA